MPDEDFQDLLESIKAHGQREPITTYENKILDGWHRFRACLQLDINPSFHDILSTHVHAFFHLFSVFKHHGREKFKINNHYVYALIY